MRYRVDHDYHIHSHISSCSNDPEQTSEAILRYAEKNGFEKICLTDHFWDETVPGAPYWYLPQNFAHISAARPLPQGKNTKFLFGAETDLDRNLTLGISKECFDEFDFVIIPTTHLHMDGFTISEEDAATPEGRAAAWISRFNAVLDMDLPFHKIGIAHLACALIAKPREDYSKILRLLPDAELYSAFAKAARVGVGIELNSFDMSHTGEERDAALHIFRIAKEQGCKFYLGSDAHHPSRFDNVKDVFERAVRDLDLTENDKFHIK